LIRAVSEVKINAFGLSLFGNIEQGIRVIARP